MICLFGGGRVSSVPVRFDNDDDTEGEKEGDGNGNFEDDGSDKWLVEGGEYSCRNDFATFVAVDLNEEKNDGNWFVVNDDEGADLKLEADTVLLGDFLNSSIKFAAIYGVFNLTFL